MARYIISGNTISIEGTGEGRIILPGVPEGLLVNTADTISRVNITTGSGSDTLRGSLGNDSLFGGDGSDEIRGGQGIDTLQGGLGNDTFQFLDSDFSTNVDFRAEADQDTINDFVSGSDRISFLQRTGASSSIFVFKFRSLPSVPVGQSFNANDLIFDQSTRTLRGFLAAGSTPNFTLFFPNTPNLGFTDIVGAIDGSPPTVTIEATDSSAKEPTSSGAGDPGVVTIIRSGGDLSQPLTVDYTIGGTATNGVDYTNISSSVVIPIGQASTTITINPLFDTLIEGNETVILSLASSVNYTIGTPNTATVTIEDSSPIFANNDVVSGTAFTSTTPLDGTSGNDILFGVQPLDVTIPFSTLLANDAPGTTIISATTISGGTTNLNTLTQTITFNPSSTAPGSFSYTIAPISQSTPTATATVTVNPGTLTFNQINGLGGDDTINGSPQNDTLNGGDGDDVLSGLNGDDLLIGGDDNDSLSGGAGNDILRGGDDRDTLTGGSGADVFQIDDSDGDLITDFNLSEGDIIKLLGSVFPGGIGILSSLSSVFTFFNPATPLVEGSNSPFISETRPTYVYNSSDGKLLLDADGVGTSSTFVLVAQLPSGLANTIFSNISIVPFF